MTNDVTPFDRLVTLGRIRTEAIAAERSATARVRDTVVMMVLAEQLSEVQAAEAAGVDRGTVREWLGKPRRRPTRAQSSAPRRSDYGP